MNSQNGQTRASKTIPSVREVIDAARVQELVDGGMTEAEARRKVRESRRMGDLYEDLLAAGHSDEQVGVLWEGKTPQQILAEAAANGITTQTAPQSKKQRPALRKVSQSTKKQTTNPTL